MGQVGLHGLTGLVAGSYMLDGISNNPKLRRALLYGFTMGNLAPDLDFLAVVTMYPIDQQLAIHLHRGFTHSLLAATVMVTGCVIIGLLMRHNYIRHLGYGLALGIVAHFVEDIFIWFAPVDIFWPASVYGLIPPVDLWSWFPQPPLLGRLLGAAEFGAFALYFDYIARLADTLDTDREMIAPVRRMATASWVAWAILTALALELPDRLFDPLFYIPQGVIFTPACFYITWRMQATIELMAVFRKPLEK